MQYTTNLNLKKPEETEFYNVNDFNDNADKIDEQLNIKAPKNSPAFTGTPTTPTPTAGDDSKKIANTQFVNSAINSANEADFNEHNADTNAHTSKIATQSEAETGTNNVKFMTPLRTKQAINKFAPVKSVNGVVADSAGNVTVPTYTHPNSGVTAGTYRSVTVNAQGHVTAGSNPTITVAQGGTGATTAAQARTNLGITQANGNQIPTGTILPFAGDTIPSGFLACNGAAVSRTTYAALFSAIGTTYGGGNGSSTFNVPQIEDNRFLEFSSTRGSKRNAGLPNITGNLGNVTGWNDTQNPTGVFATSINATYRLAGEGGSRPRIQFDASQSNSIYGNSNTVQPKSLTVRAIIKY